MTIDARPWDSWSPHGGGHDAVLYASESHLVGTAVRYLREGAARGEHLIVATTPEHTRLILREVDEPAGISVLENSDTYLSAGVAMEFYLQATRHAVASGAAGLRVVGELPPGTDQYPRTWPGWSRYEAVVNHLFAALPFRALCAYDTARTGPRLLSAVRATHPHTWQHAVRRVNPDYRSPADLLSRWSDPPVLPVECSPPLLEIADITDPRDARHTRARVSEVLTRLDTALRPDARHLPPADPTLVEAGEYLLAVDEVLANALVHGGPPVALRLWVRHSEVVTTVTDPGNGFDDAFIGYATRPAPATGGRAPGRQMGLWLARQMCDELSFRHDEEGFTVRLRAELDVRLDE